MSEVKKALDYNISKVVGCIITHEHKDHCKYIKEYLQNGIKCYASRGTVDGMQVDSPYLHKITPIEPFLVGEYNVLAFNTKHDCSEPVGYLIHIAEVGNMLFATDTYYLPNTFRHLRHILIECNYSDEILSVSEANASRKKRLLSSHMSLTTCIEALRANDLSEVETITLIHLSNDHSKADEFKATVERETGIPTYIADKGLEICLGGK